MIGLLKPRGRTAHQRAKLAFYQSPSPRTDCAFTRFFFPRSPATPDTIGAKLMNGFTYVDALNGAGAFGSTVAGAQCRRDGMASASVQRPHHSNAGRFTF